MKVLHVYRSYFPDPPGGLQEAIRQICRATSGFGVENSVFTLSPNPQPTVIVGPEAKVVRARSWAAPASCDLGDMRALQWFRAEAEQADLIHYYFPWPFADILMRVAPKRPSVLTYISDIVRQKWLGMAYAPLMWRSLNRMDAIVANCEAYVASSPVLSSKRLAPPVSIIPLGLEAESLSLPPDWEILARLGLPAQEPFILFLGVLRYYKGLHSLLEAAPSVRARIVIAGDGPMAATLKAQAEQLGLGRKVLFAGAVSEAEKVALLHAARAFVLPSHLRSEAFGMVLVEASMAAKPLVSCEISTGTSFVNQDGLTGFVVPPEAPQALVQALNRLVLDEALATRLGLAARQRYEQVFSGRPLGRAYSKLFHRVLGRPFAP